MANLYSKTVRYSFVERMSTVASSREEAEKKFAAIIEKRKSDCVGLSYGDIEAEALATKCEYKEGS